MAKATQEKTVTFYDAKAFGDWLSKLDVKAVATINARLQRLRQGNVGNSEFVGDGVFELKLNIGPGYRLYYANVDDVIIVILHSGTKRRQRADIMKAKLIWLEMQDEV
jgi:putative addiction module killer protein